jgi:hypothetical protein
MHRLFTKGNQCKNHTALNSENHASEIHVRTLPSIHQICVFVKPDYTPINICVYLWKELVNI